MCGAPGAAAPAPAAAAVVQPPPTTQRRQQPQQLQQQGPLPPALHIPIDYDFNHVSSQKIYNLDCCCCGLFKEIKEAVRVAVVTLPTAPTLLCMLRHFSCPANTPNTRGGVVATHTSNQCTKQVSRRDLEALLGAKAAAALDRGFYSAAVAASGGRNSSNEEVVLDDSAGPSTSKGGGGSSSSSCYIGLHQQCIQLATAISELHTALTSSTTAAATTTAAAGNAAVTNPSNYSNGGRSSKNDKRYQKQQQQQQRGRPPPTTTAGVGYGGPDRENTQQHTIVRKLPIFRNFSDWVVTAWRCRALTRKSFSCLLASLTVQ